MATENRTDPRKNFAPRFLPWLLAAAAFAVYWFTLNRWVSLFNYVVVAKTSGWTWQPEVVNPVLFIVTYPFRSLPAAQIPVALNFFSAVCAALTLGLLARSVAILPQNRTDLQREREHSDFSFLTIRGAWLPPVLAVAACGLQLSFWENATNCTGAMLDLLLFAFVIWSLLEYRLDEREWRLFLAALVYGADMAEDWAMVEFFPVFIAALIWARGLSFFNLRFLGRMLLCGLAGMLFYLLLPLLAGTSDKMPVTFWQALKINLLPQFSILKSIYDGIIHRQPIVEILLLRLAYLIPLLMIAFRWKSSFGDRSQIGSTVTVFMFHLVHALLLGVCIWLMFDPPVSPREKGFGLTFYYLLALSAGYYTGYFLLVFRPETESRPRRSKRPSFQSLNLPATGVFAISILSVAGLIYKNAPLIRAANGDTFQKYTALVDESLPRTGGILLCDDPRRLFLTQASLAREGRAKDFVPLDTRSLQFPSYHKFLHAQFPQKWPDTVTAAEQTNGVGPLHLIGLLAALAKTNELYYLHPSFGYYFEEFYLEPHGLVYKLKTLPDDTFLPPPLDKNQIAENEDFWSRAEKQDIAPIERALAPPDPEMSKSIPEKLFKRLHIEREPDLNATVAGGFYSRSLDFWGVELQRAGELTNAAAHFETAQKLNPDSVAAQINLQFNQKLQKLPAGQNVPVDLSAVIPDQFGKYRTWNEVLNENGPFDEPSFCFEEGFIFTNQKLFRQAAQLFDRVRDLAPDYLPARMRLAEIYLLSRQPDRAFAELREPLEQPRKFSTGESDETQLHLLAAAIDFQKNDTVRGTELIEAEISLHPADADLLVTAAQAYMARGLFPNALAVINRKLKSTPDDPEWLFSKGYVFMQLKNYDDAIVVLTRALAITNNYDALFKRAGAYLQLGKLDDARADFSSLQQSFTNSPQAAYNLGEIAWRRHETNEAIRNYGIYLANAKTNTAEATNIIERLNALKH